MNTNVRTKNPNPGKAFELLGEIHNHLHNKVIGHELSQIARHTKDKEIREICKQAANCLEIRINTDFHRIDYEQCKKSLTTLVRHLKQAKEKFDKVVELVPDLNQKWIEKPFRETQLLLLDISNYLTLLDREHDIYDQNDTVVKIGDLVAVNCTDENNKPYKHYGIVVSSSRGFRVAHFFTGETVKAQNSIVEKGFGYIHEVRYSSDWLVQEHLPKSIPYSDVEDRIKASRKIERRVWNKVSYNCEHWAREMFTGQAECTQLKQLKEERRNNRNKS